MLNFKDTVKRADVPLRQLGDTSAIGTKRRQTEREREKKNSRHNKGRKSRKCRKGPKLPCPDKYSYMPNKFKNNNPHFVSWDCLCAKKS